MSVQCVHLTTYALTDRVCAVPGEEWCAQFCVYAPAWHPTRQATMLWLMGAESYICVFAEPYVYMSSEPYVYI